MASVEFRRLVKRYGPLEVVHAIAEVVEPLGADTLLFTTMCGHPGAAGRPAKTGAKLELRILGARICSAPHPARRSDCETLTLRPASRNAASPILKSIGRHNAPAIQAMETFS